MTQIQSPRLASKFDIPNPSGKLKILQLFYFKAAFPLEKKVSPMNREDSEQNWDSVASTTILVEPYPLSFQ